MELALCERLVSSDCFFSELAVIRLATGHAEPAEEVFETNGMHQHGMSGESQARLAHELPDRRGCHSSMILSNLVLHRERRQIGYGDNLARPLRLVLLGACRHSVSRRPSRGF
jgi:hypothetical protein